MSLTRSLIPQQHRPILDQLLVFATGAVSALILVSGAAFGQIPDAESREFSLANTQYGSLYGARGALTLGTA